MRLVCLLTWSVSGTSGGPTAHGVRSVSAWRSRSVCIAHVVVNQEHSECAVPLVQDGTGMEISNANCACANRWTVPLI